MSRSEGHEVTRLLAAVGAGRAEAAEELLPLVYNQLRSLAQARMTGERRDHTLQPTALVHEAYVRLVGDQAAEWDGRGHFFAAAAEAMRRILVESARRKACLKRGGNHRRADVETDKLAGEEDSEQILAVDEALSRMEEKDPRMSEVVKLRFFAGLSIEETARALNVSDRTVRREWTFAKAWLSQELGACAS